MESFKDPFNVLTVGNTMVGLGFGFWVASKLKESTENSKILTDKVDELTKAIAALTQAIEKNKSDIIVCAGHINRLGKDILVIRKRMDELGLEADWAYNAFKQLEKTERSRNKDFKLKSITKRTVTRPSGRSKHVRYSSDEESESEEEYTKPSSKKQDEDEDEVVMKKPKDRKR